MFPSSKNMNLKQLIESCNLDDVYQCILDKDINSDVKDSSIESVKKTYSKTIDELLEKIPVESNYKIYVNNQKDWHDGSEYIDVSLLNLKFEGVPPVNLKPWGGNSENKNDCPDGTYNVNYDGYNQYMGIGNISWAEFINMEIVNVLNLPNELLLSEILWEFTFFGYTENKQSKFWKEMKDDANEAKNSLSNS